MLNSHDCVTSCLVIRHPMNILDKIVEQKKREVAQLPARAHRRR